MTKIIEKSGKTVDECIKSALAELGVDRDSVEIEILEKDKKGVFGVFGMKPARVKITFNESPSDKLESFLRELLDKMGIEARMNINMNDNLYTVDLSGQNMGLLIGRRGETLDSIQYLANLVVNKDETSYCKVVLDTENYRSKREETLVRLANKLSDRVVRYGKSITLEPMSPYERRIIHSTLQSNKLVNTYSVGEEPNRKIVIASANNSGGRRDRDRFSRKDRF